jgi:hypothetical protein
VHPTSNLLDKLHDAGTDARGDDADSTAPQAHRKGVYGTSMGTASFAMIYYHVFCETLPYGRVETTWWNSCPPPLPRPRQNGRC